jgi:hypothetical protein
MEKKIAPQAGEREARINEAMVCRLVELLNEKWGPVEKVTPKLRLIQGGKGARHE